MGCLSLSSQAGRARRELNRPCNLDNNGRLFSGGTRKGCFKQDCLDCHLAFVDLASNPERDSPPHPTP